MEAQTDIQTYLERGKQALAQGQGREAAIAYAHAAQIEPDNPMVHLGLAEANLALGSYGVVYMACRKVQEHGGKDAPDLSLRDQCVDLRTSIHKHTRINVQAATQKRQHQVDGHVDANNDVGHKARIRAEHEARAHHLSLHLAGT